MSSTERRLTRQPVVAVERAPRILAESHANTPKGSRHVPVPAPSHPSVRPATDARIEIVIGNNSAECRVTANGQDITPSLEGFRVECRGGTLPTATLFVRKGQLQATEAAIADVTVVEVDGSESGGEASPFT